MTLEGTKVQAKENETRQKEKYFIEQGTARQVLLASSSENVHRKRGNKKTIVRK